MSPPEDPPSPIFFFFRFSFSSPNHLPSKKHACFFHVTYIRLSRAAQSLQFLNIFYKQKIFGEGESPALELQRFQEFSHFAHSEVFLYCAFTLKLVYAICHSPPGTKPKPGDDLRSIKPPMLSLRISSWGDWTTWVQVSAGARLGVENRRNGGKGRKKEKVVYKYPEEIVLLL